MATIDDLRDHLFETLKSLRDPEKPMEIERAKAICDVGQTIINSAKVEVEAMRVTGAKSSTGFLPAPEKTIEGGKPLSPEEAARNLRQIRRERA